MMDPISLFIWSLVCFFIGIFFAGVVYHYYIEGVIQRAEKMLDRLHKLTEGDSR